MPLLIGAIVQWGLNILALIVCDWAFDGFTIERWGPIILAGAVLGLANVFLKPLLTFIALPLILLTFGLAYFFVNVVILLFTEWVVPGLRDRRLLDVRRRDDPGLARQLDRLDRHRRSRRRRRLEPPMRARKEALKRRLGAADPG